MQHSLYISYKAITYCRWVSNYSVNLNQSPDPSELQELLLTAIRKENVTVTKTLMHKLQHLLHVHASKLDYSQPSSNVAEHDVKIPSY